ncbi:hypothetical protein GOBAR_AA36085 [Gossypium barbadense]|uniref:Uncharacterized protein n=1 Tax=Gossypium barbadense TaxID=3634 RepID=A0A2P5W0N2_GOSBA|nr:hypothetical protein GOBAR_AA36085 [Gossypium barbadense]
MCQATMSNKAKIGSFMLLLQSWAWWDNPARHNSILVELEDIRLALDQEIEEDEFNRGIQQFECTQRVSLPPQELDDLYKIQTRGRLANVPQEVYRDAGAAISPDYLDWFRHNDKSYLLPALERGRKTSL